MSNFPQLNLYTTIQYKNKTEENVDNLNIQKIIVNHFKYRMRFKSKQFAQIKTIILRLTTDNSYND